MRNDLSTKNTAIPGLFAENYSDVYSARASYMPWGLALSTICAPTRRSSLWRNPPSAYRFS